MYCLSTYYRAAGLAVILLLTTAAAGMAQERDTTETDVEIQPIPTYQIEGHTERSVNNLPLPSSGMYGVPEETKYYKPEFRGQEYLDMAVEAYRKELREKALPSWMLRIMNAVAPFVNNRFEFGVYQIEDLPIVDRDNPHFQSSQ